MRRSDDDRPPWRPEQALSVEQAFVASTVAPAWLEGQERARGKLLPGYLADLVVLDRDPLPGLPTMPRWSATMARRALGAHPAALGLSRRAATVRRRRGTARARR